jgi:hypothetical protein
MDNEERVAALSDAVEEAEDIGRALTMLDEGLNDLLSIVQGVETNSVDLGMKVYSTDPNGFYEETRDARAVAENLRKRARIINADLTNTKATMAARKADVVRITDKLNELIERLSA